MKCYCLKRGKELWFNYIDNTKAGVKEQVWSALGEPFDVLARKDNGLSIVRVEIKEVKT